MILYHGTTARHLRAIQRHGLLPRWKTGESNWSGDVESKEEFVYLTDAYAVYYAVGPAFDEARAPADLLILKVDVDENRLYPDEDFIVWALTEGNQDGQEELRPYINPREYKGAWQMSLEHNGVVCTLEVSPERILDYRIIARTEAELIFELGLESMPTPENYRLIGSHYRRCTEVLFEQGPEAALSVFREWWEMSEATGASDPLATGNGPK
jgi:hypothetical protein